MPYSFIDDFKNFGARVLLNEYLILLPLIFIGGVISGATGFGFYIVIGPALWFFFSPTEAIIIGFSAGLSAPLLLISLWPDIIWSRARAMIFFALPGMIVGAFIHFVFSDPILYLIAGTVIFTAVGMSFYQKRFSDPVAGGVAGALTTSVGFNGPPISLALHGQSERRQRGTTIFVLFSFSLIAAIIFLLNTESRAIFKDTYLEGLLILPFAIAGTLTGNFLAGRLLGKIEIIGIFVSLAGALLLFTRGLGVI